MITEKLSMTEIEAIIKERLALINSLMSLGCFLRAAAHIKGLAKFLDEQVIAFSSIYQGAECEVTTEREYTQ